MKRKTNCFSDRYKPGNNKDSKVNTKNLERLFNSDCLSTFFMLFKDPKAEHFKQSTFCVVYTRKKI